MRSVLPEMLKTTGVPALTVVEATVTLKSGEDTDPFSQAAASSDIPMNAMIFFLVLKLSVGVRILRFAPVCG